MPNWTEEQLKNHPRRDELLGLKPRQKASDQDLVAAYAETSSVWKTAEKFGMCGQSVWERLTRLGRITSDMYTPEQEALIESFYASNFKKGELQDFCAQHGLLKTSVSRWAEEKKLTTVHRCATELARQNMSKAAAQWIADNGHPRGMLGKHHSPEALQKIGEASVRNYAKLSKSQKQQRVLKAQKTKAASGTLITPRKGSWKQGWYVIGKRRIYLRSRWEVNYAHYLELLLTAGEISAWDYEPDTFWFDRIKRGTTNYTPDFKVTYPDGRVEYHEIKGWMDPRSLTKLKRMRIHHPEITMVLRDAKWFKEHKSLAKTVPGWTRCRV